MARAPPICIHPMQGGWTHGQGNYKGCGLVEGRKWSLWYPATTSFRKCSAGKASWPKIGSKPVEAT